MAFECLTGTRVFPRDNDMATLVRAHARESFDVRRLDGAGPAREALRDGELYVVVLDTRSNLRRLV